VAHAAPYYTGGVRITSTSSNSARLAACRAHGAAQFARSSPCLSRRSSRHHERGPIDDSDGNLPDSPTASSRGKSSPVIRARQRITPPLPTF